MLGECCQLRRAVSSAEDLSTPDSGLESSRQSRPGQSAETASCFFGTHPPQQDMTCLISVPREGGVSDPRGPRGHQ